MSNNDDVIRSVSGPRPGQPWIPAVYYYDKGIGWYTLINGNTFVASDDLAKELDTAIDRIKGKSQMRVIPDDEKSKKSGRVWSSSDDRKYRPW